MRHLLKRRHGIGSPAVTVAGGAFLFQATLIAVLPGLKQLRFSGKLLLNHIFGNPQHNLGPLLNQFGGSEQAAFQAVQCAAQTAVQQQGITGVFNGLVVNVGGINITVNGNVINGCVRIGTFFQ